LYNTSSPKGGHFIRLFSLNAFLFKQYDLPNEKQKMEIHGSSHGNGSYPGWLH
jgi:hypothetical protein